MYKLIYKINLQLLNGNINEIKKNQNKENKKLKSNSIYVFKLTIKLNLARFYDSSYTVKFNNKGKKEQFFLRRNIIIFNKNESFEKKIIKIKFKQILEIK